MGFFDDELAAEMAAWEAAGLRRHVEVAGPEWVDLTSNDTLGLARHPAVIEAARRAVLEHGAGGRASRLLGGGSVLDERAERQVADWLGAEAALLFASGWHANLGLVTALAGRGDALFCDELVHASLIDAARLSRAAVRVFRHDDAAHLDRLLEHAGGARRRLVLCEGVFSMDGDAASLVELAACCVRRGAGLVVDEAHAVGLVGPSGSGAWNASGADGRALVARVVTGGKALGVTGAFVVGSAALREHLVNHARTLVFTTAVAPAVAGALAAAVELAREADAERARALARARELAERLGLAAPAAAIVPVPMGTPARALDAARALNEAGIDVRAVRPPTVPEGSARLRVVCRESTQVETLERVARILEPMVARVTGLAGGHAPTERARRPHARPLFVVGTGTGVGKTVVSALLLLAASRRGSVLYWKPVQTGGESDTETVRRLSGQPCAEPAYAFPLPASPHEAAAAAGGAVSLEELDRRLGELAAGADALVVELAGGLCVPLNEEATQADWLARHAAACVLVAESGLGTLNHTLLTLEALRARALEPRALVLVGPLHASNRATLERLSGVPLVLELAPLEPLDAESLARAPALSELERIL